jgi:flagellar biosynthetic protein FliQ
MHSDLALRMMSDLFSTAFRICAPVLGVTLLVGVAVSLFQVVTQIQEMSLTFIPKLVAAGVTLVVFGPWMLRTLTQYCVHLWSSIPSLL